MPSDRRALPLLLPAGAVFLGFFFLPLAGLLVESFRLYTPGSIGSSANAPFTLANYAELLTPAFARFFFETLRISLLASLTGLVFAFPLAYWITRRLSPRWRAIAVGFLVTLMFLSVLVRTYALELTFGAAGPLRPLLLSLGISPNGRGYIETLTMKELKLDGATRERYLLIIDKETHRLVRIIGDLLDLARLEGGGGTLRREPVAVQALFDRVRSRHERELTARHVTLATTIGDGAGSVLGDPDRLEQALQNLAANALRHTPDGGEMALSSDVVDGMLRLRVRDNGQGIPADHLPLIFDRFYKVDASRKAAGGSGLGLSIVRAIVERHGGSVSAHNDGGAVFNILLPLSPKTDAADADV